jgi:hypothetical protein
MSCSQSAHPWRHRRDRVTVTSIDEHWEHCLVVDDADLSLNLRRFTRDAVTTAMRVDFVGDGGLLVFTVVQDGGGHTQLRIVCIRRTGSPPSYAAQCDLARKDAAGFAFRVPVGSFGQIFSPTHACR